MLQSYFGTNYQQYKADTDHIATWLATTAKRCGFYPKSACMEGRRSKSKRLKGKARKEAKAAERAGMRSEYDKESRLTTYTIAVDDFIPLAKHIAAQDDPSIHIPRGFVLTLNRAISLRKEVGAEIACQDNGQTARCSEELASDGRHKFFVGVLEGVKGALMARIKESLAKEGADQTSGQKKLPLREQGSNLYANLQLEEPSAANEDTIYELPATTSSTENKSDVRYKAERANDFGEALTVARCLIHDLNGVRKMIQDTWLGYKAGKYHFITASITTNTALELCRRMEEDLQDVVSTFGGAQKLVETVYFCHCVMSGESPLHMDDLPHEGLNVRQYTLCTHFFRPVYSILKEYMDRLKSNMIPAYVPGIQEHYDPAADRTMMSPFYQIKEDRAILFDVLPDLNLLALRGANQPALDEFSKSWFKALETKSITISLAFAAQIFLDIHHAFRDKVGMGFKYLCTMADDISASIVKTRNLGADFIPVQTRGYQEQVLRGVRHMMYDACFDDHVQSIRLSVGAHEHNSKESHHLMKNHPLMCGLHAYRIRAMYHDAGITLTNYFGETIVAAHLYNALMSEHIISSRWKDMELLFAVQGVNTIFAGNRPTTPMHYARRFHLACGCSLVDLAPNVRKATLFGQTYGRHRQLQMTAHVTRMFLRRYCEGAEWTNLSLQDVEKLLEKGSKLRKTGEKTKGNKNRKVSERELLCSLRSALQAETVEFSYNYLAIRCQCLRLLLAIRQSCDDLVQQILGFTIDTEGVLFPNLVAGIMLMIPSDQRVPKEVIRRTATIMTKVAADGTRGGSGGGDVVSVGLARVDNIVLDAEVYDSSSRT